MTAAELSVIIKARDESGRSFAHLQGNIGKSQRRIATYSQNVSQRFDNLSKSLSRWAKRGAIALIGFTAGVSVAFLKAIRSSTQFEAQLAKVSTMLEASAKPMLQSYREDISRMSIQFAQSTETLSQGAYDILSAMIPPGKAMRVLATGAEAAVAGFTETGTTISALLTILKSFHMDAGRATEVSDKLFTVIKRGRTTFAEMAPVLGRLTGMVAASEGSFDEMAAAIATTTRNGLLTRYAITNLIGVYRTFLRPSKEAQSAAEKLGISLSAEWLATHSLREALERIHASREVQLKDIFTESEALTAVSIMMKDLTGLEEDYIAITKDFAGATEEAGKTMRDTFQFQLRSLGMAINEIRRALVEDLQERFEPILKKANEVLPKIREIFKDLGKSIGEDCAEQLDKFLSWIKDFDPRDFLINIGKISIAFNQVARIVNELRIMFYHLAKAIIAPFKVLHREIQETLEAWFLPAETWKKLADRMESHIEVYEGLIKSSTRHRDTLTKERIGLEERNKEFERGIQASKMAQAAGEKLQKPLLKEAEIYKTLSELANERKGAVEHEWRGQELRGVGKSTPIGMDTLAEMLRKRLPEKEIEQDKLLRILEEWVKQQTDTNWIITQNTKRTREKVEQLFAQNEKGVWEETSVRLGSAIA